ncbi:hypothetical protein PFISCL1PPCAC_5828, partial [Pristionchus fissidentatus]
SFEWSDEEMEINEEEKENGGRKSMDEDTLKELAQQHSIHQKELDRLNEVGSELKNALELRRRMEMCTIRGEIDIKLEVKVVTVFDGSMLVYLEVTSTIDWTLRDWDLLISFHPISPADSVPSLLPCSSSSYRIPPLPPSASHSILILPSSHPSQWPIVIRHFLVKQFTIRESSSYTLNVPLPPTLISHLSIAKETMEGRKSGQKSSIVLPTEFFDKFIKESLPLGMKSILNETICISTESTEEKKTRIDVYCTSSSLRQSIISSIECRSLLSYSLSCSSHSPILPVPSLQSLNSLFHSIFPN